MSNCRRLGESCPIISNQNWVQLPHAANASDGNKARPWIRSIMEVLWDGEDQARGVVCVCMWERESKMWRHQQNSGYTHTHTHTHTHTLPPHPGPEDHPTLRGRWGWARKQESASRWTEQPLRLPQLMGAVTYHWRITACNLTNVCLLSLLSSHVEFVFWGVCVWVCVWGIMIILIPYANLFIGIS